VRTRAGQAISDSFRPAGTRGRRIGCRRSAPFPLCFARRRYRSRPVSRLRRWLIQKLVLYPVMSGVDRRSRLCEDGGDLKSDRSAGERRLFLINPILGMRGAALLLAAVLSLGPALARGQSTQQSPAQGPTQGSSSYQCTDNDIFIRCLLQPAGSGQDQGQLWECASGHLAFDQDAQGQEQATFDGTCAIEVHQSGDPAWVWSGGFADHVLVCPAGELWRTGTGQQWETGPDCVEAPAPSLADLPPSDTWATAPIAWQDAQSAPAPCGWTLGC
jgi:hypothetical protein